jgi:hypothetical protein
MDMPASKASVISAGSQLSLAGTRGRSLALALLAVAVGLVVLTVTLSVTMDSSTWAEATAAAGIVATVAGAAVMLGTTQGWTNGTKVSLAALSTGVFGLGAIALAIVAYGGGLGDTGSPSAAAVTDEGAALTKQITNNQVQPPGYAHDLGRQPTSAEFLSWDNATVLRNVPGGTLLPNEVDALRGEIRAARQFALAHNTPEKAIEAGFYNTTNDVPFMGAHFLNREYLLDGVFDPAKPEGLLFSKLGNPGGEWQLVGVWFLLIPGQGGATVEAPPEGFTGSMDLWHAHKGLCTRAGVISENNTAEGCAADSGNFIGDLRWMMHVWVYPEAGADNSEGVFVYLNTDLYEQQRVQAGP